MRISRFLSGSSPKQADIARMRPMVTVVVGTEHDDDLVEATAALVEVVGAVGGEIGPYAGAGPSDDAVPVVAEIGRTQPGCAVLLEHVATGGQPLQRQVELARGRAGTSR